MGRCRVALHSGPVLHLAHPLSDLREAMRHAPHVMIAWRQVSDESLVRFRARDVRSAWGA